MKQRHPKFLTCVSAALAAVCLLGGVRSTAQSTGAEIKVGVAVNDHDEKRAAAYTGLFSELQSEAGGETSFSLAFGSEEEVEDWYDRGLIDVAVLTAGPSEWLSQSWLTESTSDLYIASLVPARGKQKTLGELAEFKPVEPPPELEGMAGSELDRRALRMEAMYRSVCLVREDSPLAEGRAPGGALPSLDSLASEHKLTFLFESPHSIAGHILPRYVLEGRKISLSENRVVFTGSQEESLKQLYQEGEEGKFKVACVSEDAEADMSRLRKLQLTAGRGRYGNIFGGWSEDEKRGDLDSYLIPRDFMLVNRYLDEGRRASYKERLQNLLGRKDEIAGFKAVVMKFFDLDYGYFQGWFEKVLGNYEMRDRLKATTVADVLGSAAEYQRTTGKEPRIALVLSGGGAKCAYQAGAVVQIERELEDLERVGNPHAKIELVVGTSGGAINALLAAAEVTKPERGQDAVRKVWADFTLGDFFQLWPDVLTFLGLCAALLHLRVFARLALLSERAAPAWWLYAGVALSLCGAAQLAAGYVHWGGVEAGTRLPVSSLVLGRVWFVLQLIFRATWAWLVALSVVVFAAGLLHTKGIPKLKAWVEGSWTKLKTRVPSVEITFGMAFGACVLLYTLAYLSNIAALVIGLALIGLIVWVTSELEEVNLWRPKTMLAGALLVVALFSIALALSLAALVTWLRFLRPKYSFSAPMPFLRHAFLLSAAALLYVTCFGGNNSLVQAAGVEQALLERIPHLFAESGAGNLSSDANATPEERLAQLSEQIIDGHLLKRDLIITASRLPAPLPSPSPPDYDSWLWGGSDAAPAPGGDDLPDNLYFYYQRGDKNPPADAQFVPLAGDNAGRLLDVVIGSGSIYPVFPRRPLTGLRLPGRGAGHDLYIVDGGFAHNTPIQAAIDWGATHIILVEATAAETPAEERGFLDSAATAFNYLFDQAQQTDKAARKKVPIFELQPGGGPESMTTFDFSKAPLEQAFDGGVRDVKGGGLSKLLRLPNLLPALPDRPARR